MEYLNVNVPPGGSYPSGAYDWMRVLAGAEGSRFNGIKMDGNLDMNGKDLLNVGSITASTLLTSLLDVNTAGQADGKFLGFSSTPSDPSKPYQFMTPSGGGGGFDPASNQTITGKWSFTGDCSELVDTTGAMELRSADEITIAGTTSSTLVGGITVVASLTGDIDVNSAKQLVLATNGPSATDVVIKPKNTTRLTVSDTDVAVSSGFIPPNANSVVPRDYLQAVCSKYYDAFEGNSQVLTLPSNVKTLFMTSVTPTYQISFGSSNTVFTKPSPGVYSVNRNVTSVQFRIELDVLSVNVPIAGTDIILSYGYEPAGGGAISYSLILPTILLKQNDYQQLVGTFITGILATGDKIRFYIENPDTGVEVRITGTRVSMDVLAL